MADYAVVVGVARYPDLSAPGVAVDLDGPDNDAQAVHDWLVDRDGGKLDPANVKLVRSAEYDPPDPNDPQPAVARIERELKWIEQQTRDSAGDRLYLYFSGHGFAPVLEEGALFTAEASQASPVYVYAHGWLRWFRKAQRFREFVLWMDCCMNYQQSIPVNEVVMRSQIGTGVPGPAFVALAAQTKSALEHRMPDGQVHGVFTWTLLKGLRGGASDERGQVTGTSLKTFLHTAMPEFLPDDAKQAAAVDLQPFVRADDGVVFQRLPARPKHKVHLQLPAAAAGMGLTIWTGRPHAPVVSERVAGAEWTGALVRGLYLAEMPEAGLRQGLQVSGGGDVDVAITGEGPAVVASDGSELFSLDVVADNPAAAIAVTDHRFERVFSATGELHERDAPGVYKIRVEFGRDMASVSEEVLLLDRDQSDHRAAAPMLASPAPIPGSALTHESHEEPFKDAADRRGAFASPVPGGAAISVMSRYWTPPKDRQEQLTFPHPMEGLELLSADGTHLAQLTEDCQVDDRAQLDPVAIWERELAPGVYFLRQTLPSGDTFEGTVVASANWITQIALHRGATGVAAGQHAPVDEAAIFMRPAAGGARPPDQDAVLEAARVALLQGRNLFAEGRGAQLQDLLLTEYEDPIAAIIGGHLLLRAMDADPLGAAARAALFDTAVVRLRKLVGPEHPDVAALSLRCADPALRADQPFTVPPVFTSSWRLITEASYERSELVPADLWKRVQASTSVGPFFVWAANDGMRAARAEQLSQWIREYAETVAGSTPAAATAPAGGGPGGADEQSLPDAALKAARRFNIPAGAVSALWHGR